MLSRIYQYLLCKIKQSIDVTAHDSVCYMVWYELSILLAYIESSGSSSVGFPYIGKQMATKIIIVWAVFSSMIGKSHKCLWIKIAQQMNTKIRKLFLVYIKSRGGNI